MMCAWARLFDITCPSPSRMPQCTMGLALSQTEMVMRDIVRRTDNRIDYQSSKRYVHFEALIDELQDQLAISKSDLKSTGDVWNE